MCNVLMYIELFIFKKNQFLFDTDTKKYEKYKKAKKISNIKK